MYTRHYLNYYMIPISDTVAQLDINRMDCRMDCAFFSIGVFPHHWNEPWFPLNQLNDAPYNILTNTELIIISANFSEKRLILYPAIKCINILILRADFGNEISFSYIFRRYTIP